MKINVSTGTIAAKWWGRQDRRPIICTHGWQDNAGSFDTLIPLLPRDLSYLAIDLPGHGHSSHIANGYHYHMFDLFYVFEEIRRVFKWPQVSLLSHSMGAIASFVYANTFPSTVDMVCALEFLKPLVHPPKHGAFLHRLRAEKSFSANQRILKKNESAPEYTYDKLAERIRAGSFNSIDSDKVKYLIERGAKPSETDPNKFQFTRDVRWKYMHSIYTDHQITLEMIKNIQAAYLFIESDDDSYIDSAECILEAVDAFRRYTPNFDMMKVAGTHHFHLNQPEMIADRIGAFILEHHIKGENTCMESMK